MKNKISVIKNYEFRSLDENTERESCFEKSFDNYCTENKSTVAREREFAENNNFDIHPILKEKRGVAEQESAVRKEAIENEVRKKLEEVREVAFNQGYQEGKSKGEKDVYEQTKIEASEKLDRLGEVIDEVLKSKIKLIEEEKGQIYDLIHKLAKWIILRELSNDGDYLKRLLDNLAQEIESRSELVVYIDKKSFENMPEFIDYAQEKLRSFKNVRVEIGHDMKGTGLILCSESEIISGTMEDQLKSLEKIFLDCVPGDARLNGIV